MGLRILKDFKEEKHIVQRERTPIDIILYAVFLYLGGLSLKGVKTRLIGITRSRTAIWKWVQKFGNAVKGKLADNLPSVIIADETMLQVKDMHLWFWYAIDPETRKIVQLGRSPGIEQIPCVKNSFKKLNRYMERKQIL